MREDTLPNTSNEIDEEKPNVVASVVCRDSTKPNRDTPVDLWA